MDKCIEHNYQYYKTDKSKKEVGYRCMNFIVVDKFICTKCGEILDKSIGDDTFNQGEMDNLPLWVKSNFNYK